MEIQLGRRINSNALSRGHADLEEDLVIADVRWPDRLYRCIMQALMYASPLLEVVPQHIPNGRGLFRAMDRLLPFFTLYNTF